MKPDASQAGQADINLPNTLPSTTRDSGDPNHNQSDEFPPWAPPRGLNAHGVRSNDSDSTPDGSDGAVSDTDLDLLPVLSPHRVAHTRWCDTCDSWFTSSVCQCAMLEVTHPITKIMSRVAESRLAAKQAHDRGAGVVCGSTTAVGKRGHVADAGSDRGDAPFYV